MFVVRGGRGIREEKGSRGGRGSTKEGMREGRRESLRIRTGVLIIKVFRGKLRDSVCLLSLLQFFLLPSAPCRLTPPLFKVR